MRKGTLLLLMSIPFFLSAQNVGIGTLQPMQKLHVNGGNFLIQEALRQTGAAPSAGQTMSMLNAASTLLSTADSTNKIYDPGGPGSNYIANLSSGVFAGAAPNCVGFEVTIVSIGLGTGDSLVISELSQWRNVQLAVGNNYSTTGVFNFNTPTLYFTFKSNSDGSNGSGFEIIIKRKYQAPTGTPVQNMAGNIFLYDTRFNKLQMGAYKNSTDLGIGSFSAGTSVAGGSYSFAYGTKNRVAGNQSFAFGDNNVIGGDYSAAAGRNNNVTNNFSFALGSNLIDFGNGGFEDNTIMVGRWNSPGNLGFPDGPIFVVGCGTSDARSNAMEVYRNGFTYMKSYVQLGESAPLIQTALITGYTMPNADNSWVFIPIPAYINDVSKIVSFQVIVTNNVWQYIPNSTHPGSYFRTNIDARNVAVGTFSGQSANLYGKPIKVFITYAF